MKILSVADIHGSMRIYENIKKVIKEEKVDVLILPGDLYPKPIAVRFETYQAIQEDIAKEVSRLFEDLNIPIYYILGNDDGVEAGITCGNNLHGKVVEHKGVYFTGYEYVRKTPFNTNRELSEEGLKKTFQEQVNSLDLNNKEPLIVIAHTPVYLKQDKLLNQKRVGSRKLKMEIEKLNPLIYLCGHIHEDFGEDMLGDTHIFNCACLHEIDLMRGYLIEIKNGEVTYQDVIRS